MSRPVTGPDDSPANCLVILSLWGFFCFALQPAQHVLQGSRSGPVTRRDAVNGPPPSAGVICTDPLPIEDLGLCMDVSPRGRFNWETTASHLPGGGGFPNFQKHKYMGAGSAPLF